MTSGQLCQKLIYKDCVTNI